MGKIVDLQNHIAFNSAQKIKRLCAPLFKQLGFSLFRYLIRFHDGTVTLLSSNEEFLKFFYEDGWYAQSWMDSRPLNLFQTGIETWARNSTLYRDNNYSSLSTVLAESFNINSSLEFIFQHSDCYEIFSFIANSNIIYSYSPVLLRRFIYYFREQARHLIRRSLMEKIKLPGIQTPLDNKLSGVDINIQRAFVKATKINRFYLKKELEGNYITKNELSCLYWILQGKTASETGIILGKSNRTVEKHIDNLKQKFNCSKQSALINKLYSLGLADILDIL